MKLRSLLFLSLVVLLSTYFTVRFFVEKRHFDRSQIATERPTQGYRMMVLSGDGIGEAELSQRLKCAGETLGWQVYAYSNRVSGWERFFLKNYTKKILEAVKPDFTLILKGEKVDAAGGKNYKALSAGLNRYFDLDAPYQQETLLSFDGFLISQSNMEPLKTFVKTHHPFYGLEWYPSCAATSYQETSPQHIFYSGNNWDPRRKGEEYKKMFSLLDQKGLLDIYGPKERWDHTPHSIRGIIPFDGTSLIRFMSHSGITLVLHSQEHLEQGVPSGRIFEGAAACTVMISDHHPFVEQVFQDSVLYIDQDLPGEQLASQIEAHYQWICSHPEEVRAMTRKAHQIFIEHYTLETQLLKLAQMHEEILQQMGEKK